MTSAQLFPLINKIYDAAMTPTLWDEFMLTASDAVKGSTTVLIFHDFDNPSIGLTRFSRFPPDLLKKYYEQFFLEDDLWYQLMVTHCRSGDVFIGSELIDGHDLRQTTMYNELLKPGDTGYLVGSLVSEFSPGGATFSISRSMKKQNFSSQEKQIIRTLVPHLQRAFLLHQQYQLSQKARLSVEEALHQSQTALLLLNDRREVMFINRKAEQLVQQNDGLTCTSNMLQIADLSQSQSFQALVHEVISTSKQQGTHPGGAMRVNRSSGKTPYQVMVTPLNLQSEHTQLAPHAAACVFLHDPEDVVMLSETILHELYQLTPAETRLTQWLFAGKTLSEICTIQDVKISTIRSQLRSIFEKTQTDNQSALMRLLGQSPGIMKRFSQPDEYDESSLR